MGLSLDYEQQPVRLLLTDVNDEVPQFQNVPRPFLAMVSSDAPVGTSVYQLMANDQDNDCIIRYFLESGKHRSNCFCLGNHSSVGNLLFLFLSCFYTFDEIRNITSLIITLPI